MIGSTKKIATTISVLLYLHFLCLGTEDANGLAATIRRARDSVVVFIHSNFVFEGCAQFSAAGPPSSLQQKTLIFFM